jgi:purine-binding chemotaxis protein CheW
VVGVLKLPGSHIEPPSQLVSDLESDYIRGVGKMDDRLVILLNIAKVLRTEIVE